MENKLHHVTTALDHTSAASRFLTPSPGCNGGRGEFILQRGDVLHHLLRDRNALHVARVRPAAK